MTAMTDAISHEQFWQFSLKFWSAADKRAALLQAQDQYFADCNLIMLFYFLTLESVRIKNIADLYKISSDDQRLILRPLRAARAGLKNTDLYEQAKELELAAEKALQQKLVAAVHTQEIGAVAEKDQGAYLTAIIAEYLSYLSVIAPAQQAANLVSKIY